MYYVYECGILPKFCGIITIPWQYPERVYKVITVGQINTATYSLDTFKRVTKIILRNFEIWGNNGPHKNHTTLKSLHFLRFCTYVSILK